MLLRKKYNSFIFLFQQKIHIIIFKNRDKYTFFPPNQILNSGILDDWIDFAIENASDEYKNSIDARIAALTLLVEIWILLPFKME